MLSVRRDRIIGLFLSLVICSPSFSDLILVADTTTSIPGGIGVFTGFETKVSLDHGDVGFIGHGAGQQGVYVSNAGAIGVVADRDTVIPEGSGGQFTAFSNFSNREGSVSIDNGSVAFVGEGTGLVDFGIYTNLGGSLINVASAADKVPTKNDTFIGFSNPAIGTDNVAFSGLGFGLSGGVFKGSGADLSVVADNRTPIPNGGGPNFQAFRFNGFSRDGEDLVFAGRGGQNGDGIYKEVSDSLSVVVDRSTPIPDGSDMFTDFGLDSFRERMSLSSGYVAFLGFGSNQAGVYTDLTGSLTKVADLSDMVPDGVGSFTSFLDVSIDGDMIAFLGVGYQWPKGNLYVVRQHTFKDG